jgi:uncharacterized membrane protein YeiH
MNIQFICEIVGTIAFSLSGAMLAVERKMDIFGVLVLGVITALGGGFMRDVILQITPQTMFAHPVYLIVAIVTALYAYCILHWHKHFLPLLSQRHLDWILNFTDAIGLGLFTVIGVNASIAAGYGQYDIYSVFLGVLTGVGGGVIRDVLAGLTPSILVRHIYATASLAGGICYQLLMKFAPGSYAIIISAVIVIVIRMAAYHWKLNLPKAV